MNSTTEYCDEFEGDTSQSDKWVQGGIEVWWGEWALATDVCAHWLGGFQDENNDVDQWPGNVTCKPVKCPKSYMPDDFDTTLT